MNLDESTLETTGRSYLFTSYSETATTVCATVVAALITLVPSVTAESNVQQAGLDFADDKKSLAAVDIQFRLRNAARWQHKSSMADDPQSSVVRKKDKLAAVIYGHADDPFERSYRVRVLRVRKVDQTNGFRREVSGTRR